MPTIEEVKSSLAREGIAVLEFDAPTPTSEAAAAAVGCPVAQIAKSILLLVGDEPVLVVTCGDMKVNSSRLKKASGFSGKVKLPAADDVLRHTGYLPGGVCPFLLPSRLPVLLDSSLWRFRTVYPAAGDDHSAVPLEPERLLSLCAGRKADVCR